MNNIEYTIDQKNPLPQELYADIIKGTTFNDIIKTSDIVRQNIIGSSIYGGEVSMGTGNSVLRFDAVDGLWLGHELFDSAPFSVSLAGALTATSLTITGGTLKYGKISFDDTTNAGYFISSSGVHFGQSATSYLKYTIGGSLSVVGGTIDGTSTIAGISGTHLSYVGTSTADAVPTGLTASSTGVTTATDGTNSSYVTLTWTAISTNTFDHYLIRYKKASYTYYQYIPANTNTITIDGLVPNTSYNFGIASINKYGTASAFSSDISQTTANATTPPATVTSTSATAGIQYVIVEWTHNTETDLASYNIYRNTTNDSGSAVLIGNCRTNYFVDGGRTGGQIYYYWIKAINTSGLLSTSFSTVQSATPRNVTSDDVVTLAGSKVLIDGTTYLSNWQKSGDLTKIDGGTMSVGSQITIGATGHLKIGQTAYNTGIGFWVGDNGTPGSPVYSLSIGNPSDAYFTYNGSTGAISLKGSVTITGGDVPWSTVSGATKPADNATVGATWGTNLSNIPATLSTPSGAGLYLSSTNLGYYSGSVWKTYMDNSGNFYLGGTSGSLQWVSATDALTIAGTINATAGKFGTATNYWGVGATGLTAVSASTDVIINYGKTDFGQDSTAGFILGYDYSATTSKFEIGSSATKIFKYDGTDFSLIGGLITGGTFRTAASGARFEIDSARTRYEAINANSDINATMNWSSTTAAVLKLNPIYDARRALEIVIPASFAGAGTEGDAKAITIDNSSDAISIDITDGGSTALSIAGCTTYGIQISHSGTNAALDIGSNVNAPCINLVGADYPAIEIVQDHDASESHGVRVTQGSDALGYGMVIDNNANSHVSHCMLIDRLADADDQLVSAVVIKSANQGTGGRACGIDFTDATIQGIMNVAADTTAVGTAAGRIPIYVGGTLKYLAYYNA